MNVLGLVYFKYLLGGKLFSNWNILLDLFKVFSFPPFFPKFFTTLDLCKIYGGGYVT